MKTYQIHSEQLLNTSLKEAWNFFSSPFNLSEITPPEMDFKILSSHTKATVHDGMRIEYSLKPLFRIPVKWTTGISEVKEYHHFTDRQLKGPYSLWEHTHTFFEKDGKVLMTDLVNYRLPLGLLGKLVHSVLVKKRIREIFDFRKQTLDKIFNHHDAGTN